MQSRLSVICPSCGRIVPLGDRQHDVHVATALDQDQPDVYVTQCRVMLGLNPTHIILDDE